MQTIARSSFSTVKTEGGLLPVDLLQRIAEGREVAGLRPADYHLLPGERLNEAINRAWNRCLGAWLSFDEQRRTLPDDESGTTLTRERWLLVLFQELGYGRLQIQRGGLQSDDGTAYAVSHVWEQSPIHLVTFRQELDRRSEVATLLKRSPHSMMQELLNRSRHYTWGFISNGLQLRILRDNASLRRAAYVEFDLESMMAGELYAEFSLLWLVCHQSRLEVLGDGDVEMLQAEESAPDEEGEDLQEPKPSLPQTATCWLERWSKLAEDHGTRAMDALRDGVAEAIAALGSGFLAHGANQELRARLRDGDLSKQAYYQQLRRLVYRLIFLSVAEERNLLVLPNAAPATRKRYDAYYSLRRLRQMAGAVRGGPHPDLYIQVRQLFVLLREGYPDLGLPGLGSLLFSNRSTPDLDTVELANQHLLAAIRALSFTVEAGVRRPVDYRNLDSEELGSIYELLLELHPQVNIPAASFALVTGAGSERKTTGSHYTATPLVENLLDTALEPVVADRLAQARQKHDTPALLEQAILSIKVCDFAAGSGHMLIGAGRRLAKHLARIRTSDEEPAPADLRTALRDVVRHCLYGVDINDMAVELCKVALWMETMEPGKPLSFLDAHIQCGNSLIGVTPGLDITEIPDDAFQPVTGDDKATAAGLRKRNKKEREGQLTLQYGDAEASGSSDRNAHKRAQMVATIEDLSEDAVAQVTAKEHSYVGYLQSTEYEWARWEADMWTAAFFWPIPAGDAGTLAAPTDAILRAVQAGKLKQHEDLLHEVRRTARHHQFFHWPLQFPEVFNREDGGFDVLLSNPPWERIKLQEKEWFAARSPEIASAPNAAVRKRMIAALQEENPALWKAFQGDAHAAENESHFIRDSDHYPLCGRGDVNTYTVFAELAREILSPSGRAGLIVPTGIATDDTTKYYFQDIIETNALASLYDFENRHAIFPDVHRSFKFCLMTLRGRSNTKDILAEFVFFAMDVDDLRDPERRFTLTAQEISLLNPNTHTCPIFRSKRDADITKGVYQRVPIWKQSTAQHNPWNVQFVRMVDPFSNKWKLHSVDAIAVKYRSNGLYSEDSSVECFVPLYEGKMMDIFDHRAANVVMTKNIARPAQSVEISSSDKTDPFIFASPRYWLNEQDVNSLLSELTWEHRWLLVQKKVTSSTNARTHIATIVPASATAESLHAIVLDSGFSIVQLAGLTASVVSYGFDFVARQKIGGVNFNFFVLEQLPALEPWRYDQICDWNHNCPGTVVGSWLLPRVLELTYTAWDLQPFAHDCGYDGPPFRWDEDRRFLLRCELDAAYFHLYGIERDDVDYIMETFPIVKRKDIKAHGEYRTKRVILEMYDAMATATQGGAPYQTRLDPPPADPRVAHDG